VATPTVKRGSKLYRNADEAVADIPSGSVLLSSGFGLCGIACRSSNRVRNGILLNQIVPKSDLNCSNPEKGA